MDFLNSPPTFRYAVNQIEQLESILAENPNIRGVAFVGRSNVGKSSLINALFGNKTAQTSKTPGRTQKINIFSFIANLNGEPQEFVLFDLPGYGHAQVSKKMKKNWDMLMSFFFEHISQKVGLICIQDSRHPNQKSDQQFNEFFRKIDLNLILVLNKIDKLKTQKERSQLQKIAAQFNQQYRNAIGIHCVSAEKKTGLDLLEEEIKALLLQQLELA